MYMFSRLSYLLYIPFVISFSSISFVCFVLFCFVLFCFVLFCFVLFCIVCFFFLTWWLKEITSYFVEFCCALFDRFRLIAMLFNTLYVCLQSLDDPDIGIREYYDCFPFVFCLLTTILLFFCATYNLPTSNSTLICCCSLPFHAHMT